LELLLLSTAAARGERLAERAVFFGGDAPLPDGVEARCALADLAGVLVPGGGDPFLVHGLAPGDGQGLAAALVERVERLDTGLLYLVASLARGPAPNVARFLEAAARAKEAAGHAPHSVIDWVEPHGAGAGESRVSGIPPRPLDLERLAGLVGWAGPLAQVMPGYEPRPQQAEVLKSVARSFNEDRHLLMEAPTGTGKSLAYLIPAAAWARQNEERVLIATHTIALQEQLLAKDLKLLEAALGRPVKATVLKGRSHYICLRKWEEEVQQLDFQTSDETAAFYARVSSWVGQTSTGDKAEVLTGADDERRWGEIASETATCIGPRCKWFARHCFAHRARREANQAEVLVTNHALLCAQLQQGNQGFPSFRRVIVDEAHHLEAVATEAFTIACSFDQIQVGLNQLFSGVAPGQGGDGLLSSLSRRLQRPVAIEGMAFPEGKDLLDLLFAVLLDGRRTLAEARHHLDQLARSAGEPPQDGRPATLRFAPPLIGQHRSAEAVAAAGRLSGCLLALAHGLGLLAGVLAAQNEEAQAAAVRGRVQLFATAGEALRGALAGRPELVGWAEAGRDLVVRLAPLSPGPQLQERLFSVYPSVALLSATLSVGGAFDWAMRGLGLNPAAVTTGQVDSPFQWQEQALLCAVDGVPAPKGASDPAYTQGLTAVLERLLPEVGGRCLVLFTANSVLSETLAALRAPMAAHGLTLLGQSIDGTVPQLVERLKSEEGIVLFGSGSFWEGIDVAGEALSCLVITRLPFRPPNSPLAQARAEQETRLGRNPFETLSLPEAVIRFKQGFGRLIRTRTDRGVVVVLDSRILPGKSEYARLFLTSLPPVARIRGGTGAVIRRTKEWLAGQVGDKNGHH
jgi:Rad3-related DNA helicase